MILKDFDKSYRDSISSIASNLKKTADEVEKKYTFNLSNNEITDAILERLKVYYQTQEKIKNFLNKRYQAPAADYFVETIIFFLQQYLKKQVNSFSVYSERQIRQRRRAIRPDISIWNNNAVIAIIECKTQLGWNRDNWKIDFQNREQILENEFPNAKAYLLVLTGRNWDGFEENNDLGSKYFCLLDNIWPNEYMNITQIKTPIEKLFKIIEELHA